MNNVNMAYYDKKDVSERLDINKKTHQKGVIFATIDISR